MPGSVAVVGLGRVGLPLALSFADEAYDEMDRLKHSADSEALKALVRQLIDISQRMM